MSTPPLITIRYVAKMDKEKRKFSRIVFRTLGGALGVYMAFMGVLMLIKPVYDTTLEKINVFTSLLLGVVFLLYALTGKSPLKSDKQRQ